MSIVDSVPPGWRLGRLKDTIVSAKNGVWGSDADGEGWDLPCVRVADFDRTGFRAVDAPTMRRIEPSQRRGRILRKHDLLLEKSGGGEKQPVGCVVTYEGETPAVCSNFVARVEVSASHSPRFVTYLHAALYAAGLSARNINQTTGIQNLNATAYFDERVPIPPFDAQKRIADFLDRKTGAIDELIAKKERLIELLEEKRQALITQAVTKGLDPNVPMKDSGIEWLGQIPVHWSVVPNKFNMRNVVDCPHETPDYLEEGAYAIVGTGEITPGVVDLASCKRVDAATYLRRTRRLVPVSGDILYSREGGRFGIAALVPDDAVCLGQRMMLFRVRSKYDSRFFMWLMNSAGFVRRMWRDTVGAASPRVNIPTTLNVRVPRPPPGEQSAIADSIESAIAHVDCLRAKLREQVGKLAEYRSALITAAVTGQLEVA